MATDMTTANMILAQLSGSDDVLARNYVGRFKMMTGAKNFLTDGNSLSFSLPGGGGFCKNGINRVHIQLTPADTYNVKFYRLTRGTKLVTVSEHTDIYCDGLRELFERETGLVTQMPRVIFT